VVVAELECYSGVSLDNLKELRKHLSQQIRPWAEIWPQEEHDEKGGVKIKKRRRKGKR
jgi:hypothetical protein